MLLQMNAVTFNRTRVEFKLMENKGSIIFFFLLIAQELNENVKMSFLINNYYHFCPL